MPPLIRGVLTWRVMDIAAIRMRIFVGHVRHRVAADSGRQGHE